VGYIAAALIKDTKADKQVKKLLEADEALASAAEWPDCAKAFKYCHKAPTPEMVKFDQDNPHHHSHHYTDIPFELHAYKKAEIGSSPDGVVSILENAVLVLQGKPVVNRAHKLTKRDALFIIAHMTGDSHQPLHIGAAYVSDGDAYVVPENEAQAQAELTQGGNLLCHGCKNVHSYWDDNLVVMAMRASKVTTSADFAQALLPKAKKFNPDAGAVGTRPTKWATETLLLSSVEIAPLIILRKRPAGPEHSPCQTSVAGGEEEVWDVQLPGHYAADGAAAAADQLAKAGARFANTLKAIWP
jgi:hypothetical protein